MRRIVRLGAMLCAAVGLAACDGANPTGPEGVGPLTPAMDRQATAQHEAGLPAGARAVKGSLEGSDEYGDFCGGGAGVLITSTGIGTVSHFGKAVMVSTTCVDLVDFSVIGPTPFSIEAANGDRVEGWLTDFAYTLYGFDLYTTVTGGTGRFEGATGEIVFPTKSTYTGVWTSGVEGWIIY